MSLFERDQMKKNTLGLSKALSRILQGSVLNLALLGTFIKKKKTGLYAEI